MHLWDKKVDELKTGRKGVFIIVGGFWYIDRFC